MKFEDYLIEQNSERIYKFIQSVKRECKTWLSAVKNCKYKVVYRGYSGKLIDKKNVRTDRKPKDTDAKTHKKLDDMFLKKVGWRTRSEGLFVSGSSVVGTVYGDTSGMCFPTGDFKFIWSPNVHDLFAFVRPNNETILDTDILDNYTDKNLCRAIQSFKEITIKCKSYYVISTRYLIDNISNSNDGEWTKGLSVGEICRSWTEEMFF